MSCTEGLDPRARCIRVEEWYITDGPSGCMSVTVLYVGSGDMCTVAEANGIPLRILTRPPCIPMRTMDEMTRWIGGINPWLDEDALRNYTDGTMLAFLWLLSFGRQQLEANVTERRRGDDRRLRRIDVESIRETLSRCKD